LRTNDDDVRPPTRRRRQILALSGGGYRGLFAAQVLENIEATFSISIRDRFDLIAGTSAGALIAAGLAHGVAAKTIRATFEQHGPAIFKRGRLTTAKRVVRAPYSAEPLSAALSEIFVARPGVLDQPISSQSIKLLVTAISVGQHRARVFGGKGFGDDDFPDISLREAILSSAAAPTYFPIREPAGAEALVDGGLVANAPELLAIAYARKRLAVDLRDLFVLGIGTAGLKPSFVRAGRAGRGILRWLLSGGRGIVDLTLNAQEDLCRRLSAELMGDRYVYVDAIPSADEATYLGLDITSREATRTLKKLAQRVAKAQCGQSAFRAFF
jgi:predicted acylesterase/phospholipase RssA